MTPEEWTLYDRLLLIQPPQQIAYYKDLETIDFDISFEQMTRAAKAMPLPPVPLIVISKGRPFQLPSDLPAEVSRRRSNGPGRRARTNSQGSSRIRRMSSRPKAATTFRLRSRNW